MGERAYNFGAGPAMMPDAVIERVAREWQDFRGEGYSAMELGHRSEHFADILARAKADLRALLAVPESHHILFLHGGATPHFAMVPLNLAQPGESADYIHTGYWSDKAMAEASALVNVRIAASAADSEFDRVPDRAGWQLDPAAAYVHICSNETIGGVEYDGDPDTGSVPLVADMSSNILSQPIDVSKYGLIYGGAQKNIGPAGLTIVIVREDLLGKALAITPSAFDYAQQAANDSMLNTPPTYGIYIAGLVFNWIKAQGGLAAMEEHNRTKAALLYDYLDATPFYSNPVAKVDRSQMNVPFKLKDAALDDAFLKGAQARGMLQLKGHRSVGGMRASIYNAMPIEGVRALVAYMKEFEAAHG